MWIARAVTGEREKLDLGSRCMTSLEWEVFCKI